ncbi:MurR/RpiR family transcriptional regulator [Streptomyces sp. NBC_00378]|uniref:MurR/RpiR family transcriptional regulator n=1 Tax=unclassified Streptomyces TaxID=2593676 RepID=UPI00224E2886|nr:MULTISPECIES: MurR/RpiR family transcriptional regulator [unclassified Streptomyces]MCX5112786.1 MurR/RpiR family transcriptional regulator [Streptomyces sp. NBC_00378]
MSSLAEEIRQRFGDLSPAERKVARVLLAGYPAAGFETVATLAERATVSAPTVIRFVNRLGYKGFPDFQAALRGELEERRASPLQLYSTRGYGAASPGAPGEEGRDTALPEGGPDVFSSEVARTLRELPPHDVQAAISLLCHPKRRIILVGGRFTHLLAQYLGLHLMQLRGDVVILPDRDVERTAVLAGLGRQDVLVVFDYRRYEPDKIVIAGMAAQCGSKVVLFTDAWLSPVTGLSDVVLPSHVAEPSPYDSMVPTLATVETVLAGVIGQLGEEGRSHLEHSEDVSRRAGIQPDDSGPA